MYREFGIHLNVQYYGWTIKGVACHIFINDFEKFSWR